MYQERGILFKDEYSGICFKYEYRGQRYIVQGWI